MTITFIYAQDKQGAIGFRNQLPWHLPNDLQFFKRITMGHTIVMGRHTFESMGQRCLPGRQSVVVTHKVDYGQQIADLIVVHEVAQVLELARNQEVMVIGGAKLFHDLWPYADQIIRTYIDASFEADVFMPPIDETQWQLLKQENGEVDDKNLYPHTYEWWIRK